MLRPLLVGVFAATFLIGCSAGDAKKKQEEDKVAWPAEPSDKTPMVWEFVELTGEGEKRACKMRMFNFSDKPVTKVQATLHYLGEGDKELDTFPWTQMGPNLIDAKGHKEAKMGAFLPEGTTKVTASIESIEYGDGESWQKPAS
jgi:hypothetical protein